jgi:hypothetical protein
MEACLESHPELVEIVEGRKSAVYDSLENAPS